MIRSLRSFALALATAGLAAALTVLSAPSAAADHRPGHAPGSAASNTHTSKKFQGVKANTGTVTHCVKDGRDVLTLSDDFRTPDAPAPHWQIVDGSGRTYLLQRLLVKSPAGGADRLNKSITVPAYIHDIAKVQIWCAWAETLLGETCFDTTLPMGLDMDGMTRTAETAMFAGVKANTGHAIFSRSGGVATIALSSDFVVPDTPAPHWQLVDSRGNAYLLNRLDIKGDKFNRTITVPDYIADIAKVQIWCAWAETLLGEAAFATPVH